MSLIDQIIAILGPPNSQDEKDRLAELAEKTDKTLEEIYIECVPELVESLVRRDSDGTVSVNQFFSEILGSEVLVRDPVPTYLEKKGERYPAIIIATADIVDQKSESQVERVSEVFRTESAKSELARKLGTYLGVEAVEVFVTFG